MDVRSTLLATLAAVVPLGLTGCMSTWNCHPPKEDFSVDEPISAERVEALVLEYGVEDSSKLTCKQVCNATYNEQRGWQAGVPDSCELALPSETQEGRVACSGKGFEYYCKGRRPLGHVEAGDPECADPRGRSLAAMAYLELASVYAFEQLARQLQRWGAPSELVERCHAAADDERRHGRWLIALATAHGARVPTARAPAIDETIEPGEVALHNAVEGCVHETFAALLAARWAERSDDLTLRRVFTKIAADEQVHGQLAWDLHDWFRVRLAPEQQRDIDAAQLAALAALPQRADALAGETQALFPLSRGEVSNLARELSQRLAA